MNTGMTTNAVGRLASNSAVNTCYGAPTMSAIFTKQTDNSVKLSAYQTLSTGKVHQ